MPCYKSKTLLVRSEKPSKACVRRGGLENKSIICLGSDRIKVARLLIARYSPRIWSSYNLGVPTKNPNMKLLLLAALFLLSNACSNADVTTSMIPGPDLHGWHADIPDADDNPDIEPSFAVRDGMLISNGNPQGHLISNDSYRNYRLNIEYRWSGEPGNCGVLVHASTPRRLYKMFPQSIECQMYAGNAGDFWCIGEDITVDDMVGRRGPKENWGTDGNKARRILNLTDGSEKEVGEWNEMVIECTANEIKVWVNGDLVNHGYDCTTNIGHIAIQAEGAPCEFRRFDLTQYVDR